MFDMKRPCKCCPFRLGNGSRFQLPPERLDEILEGSAFQCHASVQYGSDDEGNETWAAGDNPQQCAGLMAVLHRDGTPNQIMQVAQRLAGFDAAALDPHGEAYQSSSQARAAHEGSEP